MIRYSFSPSIKHHGILSLSSSIVFSHARLSPSSQNIHTPYRHDNLNHHRPNNYNTNLNLNVLLSQSPYRSFKSTKQYKNRIRASHTRQPRKPKPGRVFSKWSQHPVLNIPRPSFYENKIKDPFAFEGIIPGYKSFDVRGEAYRAEMDLKVKLLEIAEKEKEKQKTLAPGTVNNIAATATATSASASASAADDKNPEGKKKKEKAEVYEEPLVWRDEWSYPDENGDATKHPYFKPADPNEQFHFEQRVGRSRDRRQYVHPYLSIRNTLRFWPDLLRRFDFYFPPPVDLLIHRADPLHLLFHRFLFNFWETVKLPFYLCQDAVDFASYVKRAFPRSIPEEEFENFLVFKGLYAELEGRMLFGRKVSDQFRLSHHRMLHEFVQSIPNLYAVQRWGKEQYLQKLYAKAVGNAPIEEVFRTGSWTELRLRMLKYRIIYPKPTSIRAWFIRFIKHPTFIPAMEFNYPFIHQGFRTKALGTHKILTERIMAHIAEERRKEGYMPTPEFLKEMANIQEKQKARLAAGTTTMTAIAETTTATTTATSEIPVTATATATATATSTTTTTTTTTTTAQEAVAGGSEAAKTSGVHTAGKVADATVTPTSTTPVTETSAATPTPAEAEAGTTSSPAASPPPPTPTPTTPTPTPIPTPPPTPALSSLGRLLHRLDVMLYQLTLPHLTIEQSAYINEGELTAEKTRYLYDVIAAQYDERSTFVKLVTSFYAHRASNDVYRQMTEYSAQKPKLKNLLKGGTRRPLLPSFRGFKLNFRGFFISFGGGIKTIVAAIAAFLLFLVLLHYTGLYMAMRSIGSVLYSFGILPFWILPYSVSPRSLYYSGALTRLVTEIPVRSPNFVAPNDDPDSPEYIEYLDNFNKETEAYMKKLISLMSIYGKIASKPALKSIIANIPELQQLLFSIIEEESVRKVMNEKNEFALSIISSAWAMIKTFLTEEDFRNAFYDAGGLSKLLVSTQAFQPKTDAISIHDPMQTIAGMASETLMVVATTMLLTIPRSELIDPASLGPDAPPELRETLFNILTNLGQMYAETGHPQLAVAALEASVTMFSESNALLRVLGVEYLKAGQPEKAIKLLKRVIALDQTQMEAAFHVGQHYLTKASLLVKNAKKQEANNNQEDDDEEEDALDVMDREIDREYEAGEAAYRNRHKVTLDDFVDPWLKNQGPLAFLRALFTSPMSYYLHQDVDVGNGGYAPLPDSLSDSPSTTSSSSSSSSSSPSSSSPSLSPATIEARNALLNEALSVMQGPYALFRNHLEDYDKLTRLNPPDDLMDLEDKQPVERDPRTEPCIHNFLSTMIELQETVGNHAAAFDTARFWFKSFPMHHGSSFALARMMLNQQRYSEASGLLAAAAVVDPTNNLVHYQRVVCAYKSGDYHAVIDSVPFLIKAANEREEYLPWTARVWLNGVMADVIEVMPMPSLLRDALVRIHKPMWLVDEKGNRLANGVLKTKWDMRKLRTDEEFAHDQALAEKARLMLVKSYIKVGDWDGAERAFEDLCMALTASSVPTARHASLVGMMRIKLHRMRKQVGLVIPGSPYMHLLAAMIDQGKAAELTAKQTQEHKQSTESSPSSSSSSSSSPSSSSSSPSFYEESANFHYTQAISLWHRIAGSSSSSSSSNRLKSHFLDNPREKAGLTRIYQQCSTMRSSSSTGALTSSPYAGMCHSLDKLLQDLKNAPTTPVQSAATTTQAAL